MAKNGVGKAPGDGVGNGEPRLRHQRKRPRRCAIGCYHASAFILAIGIVVALSGICSSRLFEIFLYDNRHPPMFHHLSIHVGLFDSRGEKISYGVNPTVEELEYPPNLDEPRWLTAKAAAVIGLIFGLVALIIHLVLACCVRGREDKPWGNVAVEVLCYLITEFSSGAKSSNFKIHISLSLLILLFFKQPEFETAIIIIKLLFYISVIGLLVSLSLAESEIEGVHNHGDETLLRMLEANELLRNGTEIYRSAIPVSTVGERDVPPLPLQNAVAEFNLVLSEPRQSFYVLIAADFICLLAFLMALVYFVRLSEREEQSRKQLQKAKVAKPISERPTV
ncbi:unnamed protein product [Rodentolepis nana]|uniref:Uncharacterized protein n=1 Tax=Rodentolepis nana TaxID=102285 RepID=A0A158QI85_RODNA|nr:unnamed protein product [Rodentolepis nana]